MYVYILYITYYVITRVVLFDSIDSVIHLIYYLKVATYTHTHIHTHSPYSR